MPPRKSAFSDPIEKVSVVDQLAARIRQRILSNEIEAGDQLRQEALAEAYGVSRMPIREALRQLESEGLVVFNPHKGVIVSSMSIEEAAELFDLRLLLEPDLLRRGIANAGSADHTAARNVLDRMNTAYETRDTAHWGELNAAFHDCLYSPAARGRTLALVQSLNSNLDRYVRLQLTLESGGPERARDEHEQLLQHYLAGEADAAVALLEAHIRHARDALIAELKRRPEFADQA